MNPLKLADAYDSTPTMNKSMIFLRSTSLDPLFFKMFDENME